MSDSTAEYRCVRRDEFLRAEADDGVRVVILGVPAVLLHLHELNHSLGGPVRSSSKASV